MYMYTSYHVYQMSLAKLKFWHVETLYLHDNFSYQTLLLLKLLFNACLLYSVYSKQSFVSQQ
jgi:hypothetical protein